MMDLVGLAGAAFVVGMSYYAVKSPKEDCSNRVCRTSEVKNLSGTGISISENFRLSEKQSNEHIACIMPSGSRKTRSIIIKQNILLRFQACYTV
jgi:hypothetical protein